MKKIIFLWGFMGSGKTTIGQLLAQKLDFVFVDLDDLIVEDQACSIVEIFQNHGEKYFRALEKKMIVEILSKQELLVISCGGGTPCFNDLHEIMNLHGTTVYLECEVSVLIKRLKNSKEIRPLISNALDSEIIKIIEPLLKERSNIYYNAQLIIPNNSSLESGVNLILKKLKY